MSNKSEQAERRALAGSNSATTYHAQAMIGLALDTPGGRFRVKETITGAEPSVDYPKGPDWTGNGNGVGVEPPLGFAIDSMEAVGTAAEIDASLAGAEAQMVASPAVVETALADPVVRRRRLQ